MFLLFVFLVIVILLAGYFISDSGVEEVIVEGEIFSFESVVEGNSYVIDDGYIDPLDQEILDLEYKDESQDEGGKNWMCYEDSECGSEYGSGAYCLGGNVYEDIHSFSCDVVCREDVNRVLVEECFVGCSDGECVSNFSFDCSADLDCGVDDFVGDRYCMPDDNAHQIYVVWSCLNPGSVDSMCSFGLQDREVDVCGDDLTCSEGECVSDL